MKLAGSILAQGQLPDPHSPAAVGWFCIIAVSVLGMILVFLKLLKELKSIFKGDSERRDVRITVGCVEQPHFERHVQENAKVHEQLFAKVGGVERGMAQKLGEELNALRSERKGDSDKLAERLSSFDVAIGGLQASTEFQNRTLASISATMNRVLEKVGKIKGGGND